LVLKMCDIETKSLIRAVPVAVRNEGPIEVWSRRNSGFRIVSVNLTFALNWRDRSVIARLTDQ